MAELSNNPFIDHTASVVSRFPNINAVSSPSPPGGPEASQYSAANWPQQPQQHLHLQQQQQQQPSYPSSAFVSANPTGYSQQYFQQPQWPQQQQQQQQQQPQYQPQLQQPSYSPASYQSPSPLGGAQYAGQANSLATTGYPQSQMQAQYTGYPTQQAATYGYQQQQPQQPTGYGYPQQQQQQQQQLLAQFDPYVNLGQQLHPQTTTTSASIPSIANSGGGGGGGGAASAQQQQPPPGVQHPRAFIRSHKAGLEAWDQTTWKQVQSCFDALKTAWETRKHTAEAQVRALGGSVGAPAPTASGLFGAVGTYGTYGGGYQTPQAQEIDRLNALIREADSNIDAIAAGAVQMTEMFGGYRHSSDIASKRRVREACNAAVAGLPEYPPSTLYQ